MILILMRCCCCCCCGEATWRPVRALPVTMVARMVDTTVLVVLPQLEVLLATVVVRAVRLVEEEARRAVQIQGVCGEIRSLHVCQVCYMMHTCLFRDR